MKFIGISYLLTTLFIVTSASARVSSVELTQKSAETQIRNILEPLLDKYCHDECKLMNVNVTVDLANSDAISPGFDDPQIKRDNELIPVSAQAKLLMDDKVGPISRGKLLELIQQYLDTLDYPVKISTQVTHFPLPQGSEGKISELREKVSKQFISTVEDLLHQFCPHDCLLVDFALKTDVVNGEEAQYGSTNEFVADGDTAIKIKNISATLLMDEKLSVEEQANILEMVRLKTNKFKNVELEGKSLKFPHPVDASTDAALAAKGLLGGKNSTTDSKLDSKTNSDSKTENKMNSDSRSDSKVDSKLDAKSDSKSDSKTDSKLDAKSTSTNSESNLRQEKYERLEKIERVESGDAVQKELQKFKVFGLIFACSILALLIFIALATYRPMNAKNPVTTVQRVFQDMAADPMTAAPPPTRSAEAPREEKFNSLSTRYEIERLLEELRSIYAQQPKVAKQVFTRVLTEEGVEVTSECIHLFGESIVIDMLRDPSLQTDLNELMEFYAKNPIELNDEKKLDLLRKLHSRTIAGKLVVIGNRSSGLFDFLSEMDGLQILELIRTESLTVKSIILTQCDAQKRGVVYSQMDADIRMKLLAELSRIDYLPRDYIFNVATALKRKRRENPKLNTEALPGSEVLVSLLERTGQDMQKSVVKNLETTNPDSARTVKSKLVSVDTLRFLRDGQLLEVVLSLKHDELIQFLKGATHEIRSTIFAKSPKELVVELEEELGQMGALSRETYQQVERKILNRMKIMANEGQLNLVETNERMFNEGQQTDTSFVQTSPGDNVKTANFKKVAGW
jgi:flagellar motor switch protein FliG